MTNFKRVRKSGKKLTVRCFLPLHFDGGILGEGDGRRVGRRDGRLGGAIGASPTEVAVTFVEVGAHLAKAIKRIFIKKFRFVRGESFESSTQKKLKSSRQQLTPFPLHSTF